MGICSDNHEEDSWDECNSDKCSFGPIFHVCNWHSISKSSIKTRRNFHVFNRDNCRRSGYDDRPDNIYRGYDNDKEYRSIDDVWICQCNCWIHSKCLQVQLGCKSCLYYRRWFHPSWSVKNSF